MAFIKSLRRLSRQASAKQKICSTGTIHMWAVVTITKLMRKDMRAGGPADPLEDSDPALKALVEADSPCVSPVQVGKRMLEANSAKNTSQSIGPRQSNWYKWGFWPAFAAFASLISMLGPLLLLCYNFLAPGSNCAAHTHCKAGEACVWGGSSFLGFVCRDCDDVARVEATWNETHCTSLLKDRGIEPWDEADHTKIDIVHEEDKDVIFCFTKWHCDETDAMKGKCDHFFVNKAGFSLVSAQGVVLMGLSLIAAMALAVDMDETTVEEILLNHKYEPNHDSFNFVIFAAHVVRLTLRIRRLVLPGVVSTATVNVLVENPLTSSDIIMNMLAITFFVEIDDMLALFVLPATAIEDMETQAAKVSEEWQDHKYELFGQRTAGAWIKVRLSACVCAVFVVLVVHYLDVIAALLNDQTCGGIKRTFVSLAAVPALLNIMIEMVHELYVCCAEGSTLKRSPFRTMFREFSLDLLSVLIYVVVGCRVAGWLAPTLRATGFSLCALIVYVVLWFWSQMYSVGLKLMNCPSKTIGRSMRAHEYQTHPGERQNESDVDKTTSQTDKNRAQQLKDVELCTGSAGDPNRSRSVEHDTRSWDVADESRVQPTTDQLLSRRSSREPREDDH